MTKLLTTAALAAFLASTAFANAAQLVVVNPNLPILRTVALNCSAGHGDVAQTIYVTNTTGKTILKGTKISWKLNGVSGSFILQSNLGVGQMVSDLANPGNGGACTAYYFA